MIVVVKIVDRADVETGGVFSSDCIGGLMKNFTPDNKILRHLLLQQPAEEPIVLVVRAAAMIDPIAATAIGSPIAKAFLHPNRKVRADMASAEAAGLVASRNFEERKHPDHWT